MVKVNLQLDTGILDVPDTFATLVTVPGLASTSLSPKSETALTKKSAELNELAYVIEFDVDLGRALSKDAAIVEVKAYRLEQFSSVKSKDPLVFVEQIQKAAAQTKGKAASIGALVLASVHVDITSKADNSAAKSVGVATTGLQAFRRSVRRIVTKPNKELSAAGLDLPVLESSALDAAFPRAVRLGHRAAAQELLVTGIDPAAVAGLKLQIDSVTALAGFGLDASQAVSRDPSDVLRERFMALTDPGRPSLRSSTSYDTGASLPVVVTGRPAYIPFHAWLKLPSVFSDSKFVVTLTLRDSLGAVVDFVTKQVEHSEQVRLAVTPTVPPSIKFGRRKGLGIGHLVITQRDERATSVVVYKKVCTRTNRLDEAQYSKIADVNVTVADGHKILPVSVDSTSPMMFRCVAAGVTGELAQEFSSTVVNPGNDVGRAFRNDLFSNVSVVARIDKVGVAVELRSVPPGVVAVSVHRRDLTLFERTPTALAVDDGIIAFNENTMVPITFVDDTVKSGHVYEYSCVFVDRFGSRYPAASVGVIEFVPFIDNLVDTVVKNSLLTVIDDSDIDYTFDIITNLLVSDLQVVKGLMDTQEILSFFSKEIQDERALLQKLLAHQVVRYNLTTGAVESFGVVTGENFSDKALRKINGVSALRRGNTYRYEVYALLRSPETLLNALTSNITTAGKTYAFKPSKFLHPLALQVGNITDSKSRHRNHARDEMTFGRIGNVADNELSLSVEAAEIIELNVEKLSDRRVLLQWKLAADSSAYDHFLIGREALGEKSLVGATHNVPRAGKFEYVHEVGRADVGSLRFFVIPVKNDYSLGKEVTALPIVIER